MRLFLYAAFAASVIVATACGGRPGGVTTLPAPPSANEFMRSITPQSVSPGSVTIPPMQGLGGTRPAMSLRMPQGQISALNFTQLPGAAVRVAASPDGTFWVLSTQGLPNGDKYIYHYVNGGFVNVPGAASRIAVGPDGTPWVINAAGGIYHLVNGVFTGIAGAASELSVGGSASAPLVDVISNQSPGPYGAAIYQYNVNAGKWSQLPGAGVTVAASIDSGTYSALNINPGGFYVTNQVGGIYYYNVGIGFEQLPGGAISLAPTASGGIFALGDPANPVQHGIYYNDLSTGTWTQMPGAAISISANGQNIYAIGAAGGIYVSPVSLLSTPSPLTQSLTAQFCNVNNGGGLQGCSECHSVNEFCGQITDTASIAIDLYTAYSCSGGADASSSSGVPPYTANLFLPGFPGFDGTACTFPVWSQKISLQPGAPAATVYSVMGVYGQCTEYPPSCSVGIAYAAVPAGASAPPTLSSPQITWTPAPSPTSNPNPSSTPIQSYIPPGATPPPDSPHFSPGGVSVFSPQSIITVAISQSDYAGPFEVSSTNPVGGAAEYGCPTAPNACFPGCAFTFSGPVVLQAAGTVSFKETTQWTAGIIAPPGYFTCYLYGYDENYPENVAILPVYVYSQI